MSVLLVTNHVPPDRAGAFQALHARLPIELALFGGRSHHATEAVADPGVPHRHVSQRELGSMKGYDAVVCGTAGRLALPASYAAARRARVPFVLWSALWAQPRSPAHAAGALLLQRLYSGADAVVGYGPHVARHARQRGARRVFTAPQAVDQAFWCEPGAGEPHAGTRFLFVGRPAPEKGLAPLLEAWAQAALDPAELVVVGDTAAGSNVVSHPTADPPTLRNFYAAADVLVVPSVPTRTFREPWGLVCNEAMHQGLPIIATDAVGAAAGGLVRHGRSGLVVPAGEPTALAEAMTRLHEEPALRQRMGLQARRDAAPFTFDAWADGMVTAITSTLR